MYKVKSKSTGSYFGKYLSRKSAEIDAEVANDEQKAGTDDWEAVAESRSKAPDVDRTKARHNVQQAVDIVRQAQALLKDERTLTSAFTQAVDRLQDLEQLL